MSLILFIITIVVFFVVAEFALFEYINQLEQQL